MLFFCQTLSCIDMQQRQFEFRFDYSVQAVWLGILPLEIPSYGFCPTSETIAALPR